MKMKFNGTVLRRLPMALVSFVAGYVFAFVAAAGHSIGRVHRDWVGATLATLLLAGCGDPRLDWTEQVKLQSGEVISVARSAKFSENWIAGGGGGSFNKGMTLQIVQPAKPDNPGIWDARFVPILLDRDPETKEWFVVATFFHCDSWYELGRPKLPYTEYRFRNGRWVQQPLTPKWIGREGNVMPVDLADKGPISESKPTLTLEHKERIFLDRPGTSPEYRRVVDKWSTGC